MCDAVSQPRQKAHRLTVETRPKIYPLRKEVHRHAWTDYERRYHSSWLDDPGGRGRETVREIVVCQACQRRYSQRKQE
ncbi:MAG: hypothetical protein KF777_17450 [Planctomycetaceae bacterium]|nr:hypothetical protein [Planctomycetaceae bacterium]